MPEPVATLLLDSAHKLFEVLIKHMQENRVGLPELYRTDVKKTVSDLLSADPEQPGDRQKMARFIAQGGVPSYKDQLLEEVDPASQFSIPQQKKILLQQKLVQDIEHLCFDFIELIICCENYDLPGSLISGGTEAADTAMAKNYCMLLFRKIVLHKNKEKTFFDKLDAFVKQTQEEMDDYRERQYRRTLRRLREEHEGAKCRDFESSSSSSSSCLQRKADKKKEQDQFIAQIMARE